MARRRVTAKPKSKPPASQPQLGVEGLHENLSRMALNTREHLERATGVTIAESAEVIKRWPI